LKEKKKNPPVSKAPCGNSTLRYRKIFYNIIFVFLNHGATTYTKEHGENFENLCVFIVVLWFLILIKLRYAA